MHGNRYLAGLGFGLLAYLTWGFFPLYFRQLSHVSIMDVLSHRAAWACLFVGLLQTLRGQWGKVRAVFGTPRGLAMLALAALLIASNWLAFLWAVANQQVVASSLGYSLTPLVNVLPVRGAVILPMVFRTDLSVSQDVFKNIAGRRNSLQFRVDIANFGNLLNSDWGVGQRLINAQPLTNPSADSSGRMEYRLRAVNKKLMTTSLESTAGFSDVYSVMFSLRYQF